MWIWAPWSSGQGWDEKKEKTKKQQNTAERQTRPHGYYHGSRTEELSPKASETVAMDKGKVKPPGGTINAWFLTKSIQYL